MDPQPRMLIAGQWLGDGHESIDVLDPADESVVCRLPVATDADIDAALDAAQGAFAVWRATSPAARSAVLARAAALLRQRCEEIAPRITRELGKTLAESRSETIRAADILEWDAGEALRLYGRVNPSAPGWRQMVLRQPIGPVAAFTPWNAPIGSPARKISGALAAGCSMVLKPAEETPSGAIAIAQALIDAGLPPGVLNILFGRPQEMSARLIASPVIRMVTFTGSVAVGRQLAHLCAQRMLPSIMELGGHAPVIVCADADPLAVARLAATAKFRMAGQICVSPTRFLVHESIHAAFVQAMAQATQEIRTAAGTTPATAGVQHMGAMANARRLGAIHALVDDALHCGARLVAGGHRIGERGFFFEPTVLADVPPYARAMTEEPFGPLAIVNAFQSLDEAIAVANQLPAGLAAYAFTSSLESAERLSDQLQCGLLSINHFGSAAPDMPFGGVKESGFGREGGAEGVQAYTTVKMVSLLSRAPSSSSEPR